MANTTEFVTAIIHRWNPGSYTMELLLGGVEADYKIPSTKPVAAAKKAVDALVNTPGAVEDMEFKFPTIKIADMGPRAEIVPIVVTRTPTSTAEIIRRQPTSDIPNWVKEADKTSVEREEVNITRVETVKRIVKLTSSLLWRR